MSDKPSPFTGLDKALLRSTKQQEAPAVPTIPVPQEVEPSAETLHDAPRPRKSRAPAREARKQDDSEQSSQEDDQINEQASEQSVKHASKNASKQDSMLAQRNEVIARVRKAVRTPGKEVSFVRLTPDEKQQLVDIVYSYKRQGKKTSENEINRIAINCLLEDYRANGDESMLAQVIEALLA